MIFIAIRRAALARVCVTGTIKIHRHRRSSADTRREREREKVPRQKLKKKNKRRRELPFCCRRRAREKEEYKRDGGVLRVLKKVSFVYGVVHLGLHESETIQYFCGYWFALANS